MWCVPVVSAQRLHATKTNSIAYSRVLFGFGFCMDKAIIIKSGPQLHACMI